MVEEMSRRRQAGKELMLLLKTLLAVGKISHQDFGVACWWADKAGVVGESFSKYGLRPGLQTGKYARNVKDNIKVPKLHETVSLPCKQSPKHPQYEYDFKMAMVHETLWEEVKETPDLLERTAQHEFPECYTSHPVTIACEAAGEPPPLALALYTDGVRYTSPLNSNTDSTTGIWLVNVLTKKRHLVCDLRGTRMCACGCRGWCTMFVALRFVAWCLESLASGQRPDVRYDGQTPPPDHPIWIRREKHGHNLKFRGAVCWLKGDWMDAHKTHGLPAVGSKNSPCPFCTCTSTDMHLHYDSLSLSGTSHAAVQPGDYESACNAREVPVRVNDEAARALLIGSCSYQKGDKKYGLTVIKDVPEFGLKSGDHAAPSDNFLIVRHLYTAPVGFTIMFWRAMTDSSGNRCGVAVHRNPLFKPSLGLEPVTSCAIDFMHTICFGTVQRLISCILWRGILGDVYKVGATNRDTLIESSVRRLRGDIFDWYFENSVPHEARLGDITAKMLGGDPGEFASDRFGGDSMRLKAHETLVLLPFAVGFVGRHSQIADQCHLLKAGEAMVDFLSILKREPMKVHSSKLQPLLDLMQLHLSRCELANLTFVPKMHFAAHLVCRTAGPDVELAGHPMHRCPPSSLPIPPSGSRHRSHSNHRSRSSHRTSTASTQPTTTTTKPPDPHTHTWDQ